MSEELDDLQKRVRAYLWPYRDAPDLPTAVLRARADDRARQITDQRRRGVMRAWPWAR